LVFRLEIKKATDTKEYENYFTENIDEYKIEK